MAYPKLKPSVRFDVNQVKRKPKDGIMDVVDQIRLSNGKNPKTSYGRTL
jgi:hypothetical protein